MFVSLANGELVVYKRDSSGAWDTSDSESVTLATGNAPINKMVVVTGKLWCTAFNDVMVVNPDTLETEVNNSCIKPIRSVIKQVSYQGHMVAHMRPSIFYQNAIQDDTCARTRVNLMAIHTVDNLFKIIRNKFRLYSQLFLIFKFEEHFITVLMAQRLFNVISGLLRLFI